MTCFWFQKVTYCLMMRILQQIEIIYAWISQSLLLRWIRWLKVKWQIIWHVQVDLWSINMSIEQQADEVTQSKTLWKWGIIIDPFYLTPSHTIAEADELMGRYRISGVPVVETLENRKLVGILTNRDLRFISDYNQPISNHKTRWWLHRVGTDLKQLNAFYKSNDWKLPW